MRATTMGAFALALHLHVGSERRSCTEEDHEDDHADTPGVLRASSCPSLAQLQVTRSVAAVGKEEHEERKSRRTSFFAGGSRHLQPEGKTLVYITTHMPEDHRGFLETCWPAALKHSELLSAADVMVFNSGPESYEDLLRTTFAEQDLTIHHEPVLRDDAEAQRQDGAKMAMQRAFEEKWFASYDWVIRVNPDVIVRDGAALQSMMSKQDVDGVFIDCFNAYCPDGHHCRTANVQTDFTCFRPSKVCSDGCGGAAALAEPGNAETLMTRQVAGIINAGRDAWLRDAQGVSYTTHSQWRCKASTRDGSPVAHYHHYPGEDDNSPETCLAWFQTH